MKALAFHDFYAPINGVARLFCMACCDGAPVAISTQGDLDKDMGKARAHILRGKTELLNVLLRDGIPWAALASCRDAGDMGAIIEAAEARRLEIYGRRDQGSSAA